MRIELINNALQNWRSLNAVINRLEEDELAMAIKLEVNGPARAELLKRLHARYCKLRSQREREALLENAV